ncbi:tripartite tricarboxylate transporter TctB family protein [Vreelandella titanicae]|jgi:putative tricarboxylic transport membrane protein|uniref:tripartite tricarboxylate transporter TctB family protein n=1 Tax=Halomonadaceae TaxID=28256 RepID=UPI000481D116|nr:MULTISPECIES: tripartite tricarboxylate transporter TctB family protein [Halomonas]MCE7519996.1 tripartite tricarboxylate transporter TctB family protein [Halomonas titanicae]PKH60541.1 tripartite tricarboxylate transporter TctB family protein [Halomonas sp. Choline-3u-9]QGQ71728.1 tripartite tricarboxylate transporter TctB family protein [Halomonas sp. PA16-9]|tara:strand:+ start:2368 stop:2844 length:477 start_codon:yes stop_codon:yes gene_type:complete
MIDQKPCTQDASDRFDFLIGAITVSFALFVIFLLIPVGVETTTYHSQLSPGFFPKLACIFIGLFGAMLMFKNRHWALRRIPHNGSRILLETLAWLAWAIATMLLLMYVGFVVTAAVSCFTGIVLAGQRRYLIRCALGSILLPLALQQLAWHAFYIQLP